MRVWALEDGWKESGFGRCLGSLGGLGNGDWGLGACVDYGSSVTRIASSRL